MGEDGLRGVDLAEAAEVLVGVGRPGAGKRINKLYGRSVELITTIAQNHLSSARARPQGATGVYFKVNEDGDRGRKPRSTQMNCAIISEE